MKFETTIVTGDCPECQEKVILVNIYKKDAIAQGFTEPDPREDLGGNDVARKLLILARELELESFRWLRKKAIFMVYLTTLKTHQKNMDV